MFCPLCHAEYREGFSVCSTCHALLVAADALESERQPPRLKWTTHAQREADAVFTKLFEAGIPCLEKTHSADFFSVAIARKRPVITLYILERDAAAARPAAGVEFAPDRPEVVIPEGVPLQDCPFCSVKFPAGQNFCPSCGGDLLTWNPDTSEAAPPADAPPSEAEGLEAAPDEGEAEMVWRGGDPVIFSRAVETLRENGIFHRARQTAQHLAFGHAMPRPRLEILVRAHDAERARELVSQFQDPFPLLPQEPFAPADANSELPAGDPTFRPRLMRLRWGIGLHVVSLVLWVWILRTGPAWFVSGYDLVSFRSGPVQRAAVGVLLLTAFVANLSALFLLLMSWARKQDKIGLLSLFFELQGIVLLGTFLSLLRG